MTAKAQRAHPAEYLAWRNMRKRCNAPTAHNAQFYHHRGIRIHPRWNDFANFLYDMGKRPSPDHSLDRRDNNADYGPHNCRWATAKEQQQNRSDNRIIETPDHGALCIAEAGRRYNLPRNCLHQRLATGWPVHKALTTPVRAYKRSA